MALQATAWDPHEMALQVTVMAGRAPWMPQRKLQATVMAEVAPRTLQQEQSQSQQARSPLAHTEQNQEAQGPLAHMEQTAAAQSADPAQAATAGCSPHLAS